MPGARHHGAMGRVEVTVRGRVQGVGYRYDTRARAERLGLAGWVRNRADGSVEACLEGDDEAIEALLAWMGRGPAGATVTSVDAVPAAPGNLRGFEIRPTA